MEPSLVRLSKFLSLVLRHHPERIGLKLDGQGWAEIEELLDKAQRADVPLSREALEQVVERNDKPRFALSPDGRHIRARYGHSIPVDLQLSPTSPPDQLYHGTAKRGLDAIRREGLTARDRKYVHLSGDAATALTVGRRHGAPIVLAIQASRMKRDGYSFYRPTEGLWLTESVPPGYIAFPPETKG